MSQLRAFVLKLQKKNLHGQKYTVWKTDLIPQHLLTRMLYYIQLWIFSLFLTSLVVVSTETGNGLLICVFTNTMNNSAQLEDRELLLLTFLLTIKEMHSSAALGCAACVCFLKTVTLGKNPFKLCKNHGKWRCYQETMRGSETVWHTMKLWELRGLKFLFDNSYQLK